MMEKYGLTLKSVWACILGATASTFCYQLIFVGFLVITGSVELSDLGSSFTLSQSVYAFLFLFFSILIPLIVIGLPVQFYLQKHGLDTLMFHAFPAAIAGTVLPLFLGLIFYAPFFGVLGFISGTVAWIVRRPDLDAHPVQSQ